ncbi:MAG: type IVB secretion system lipoprotein DotD [Proteobacteria bacterium]|nr:type IVB secretion system lipoprotein DotD [Pseudomonadota bacterium]
MKKHIISLAFLSLICGCGAPKPPTIPLADHASVKLAESANSVSDSLSELARVEAASTPASKKKLPDPQTFGMSEVASIDWSGPIQPIVQKIAHASRYKLRTIGKEPAIPVIITISAKDLPLGTILRDIAFQAGKKANIFVYPRTRTIELRYAEA